MSLLNLDDQKRIDKKIQEIYLKTGFSYPENSLLEMIKKLDIEIYLADFGDRRDEISGLIKKGDRNEKPQIFLNKKESAERRTFTLAHELGHYLLHDGEKYRIDKYNYQIDTKESREESEANYFAASLLMPKEKFIDVYNKTNNLKIVAEYFGVSEAAVINRLRWIQRN